MDVLQEYTQSVVAYNSGDRETAAKMLSAAVGSEKPLKVVDVNLDRLLKPRYPLSEAVLRLLAAEQRRRDA